MGHIPLLNPRARRGCRGEPWREPEKPGSRQAQHQALLSLNARPLTSVTAVTASVVKHSSANIYGKLLCIRHWLASEAAAVTPPSRAEDTWEGALWFADWVLSCYQQKCVVASRPHGHSIQTLPDGKEHGHLRKPNFRTPFSPWAYLLCLVLQPELCPHFPTLIPSWQALCVTVGSPGSFLRASPRNAENKGARFVPALLCSQHFSRGLLWAE